MLYTDFKSISIRDLLIQSGDDYHWVKDRYCHFYTAKELENEFTGMKVDIVQKVGLEGFNIQEPADAFSANHSEAW